jgi:putative exporter of polyketide antibiotics
MARAILWIAILVVFVTSAFVAISFTGFGVWFPLVFVFVVAALIFVLTYPLRERYDVDHGGAHERAKDPVIPADGQPDYRGPWLQ